MTTHYRIMSAFVEHGRPPADLDPDELDALAAEHGVVLHPNREIWIAHPFSASPTATWVTHGERGWWAPCLWCAMGIVTLCAPNATIHCRLGGEHEGVTIDAAAVPSLYVHFPIPPRNAWTNVVHWCASVLPFARPNDVDPWCERHGMSSGAIVPLTQVKELARVWYGRHLDRDWRKHTLAEAQAHFESVGLTGEFWRLPTGDARY